MGVCRECKRGDCQSERIMKKNGERGRVKQRARGKGRLCREEAGRKR